MGLLDPRLIYALVASFVPGSDASEKNADGTSRLTLRDTGQIGTGAIMTVVVSVIVLIVVVFLLSGVADPYFNATENITEAIETASTGNTTIDSLLEPFGLLVAAVLVIAFIAKVTDQI